MIYTCSAPGTLMLFGEHAVLRDKQAICCAVDQRMRVTLIPRSEAIIRLNSPRFGEKKIPLSEFAVTPPFNFVTTCVDTFLSEIPSGFDLNIEADFSSTMGLGSSAAVTVATLGVLAQWLQKSLTPLTLFKIAKEVIVKVQGVGSGADAAAAIFGGIVAYRMLPLTIQSFPVTPSISLIYSGAKVPTKQVISLVSESEQAAPARYKELFEAIDACACQAVKALELQDWPQFGKLMNQHQILQENLGVSTPLLNELVAGLNAEPDIFGAKISGSGLGDCVVGLGSIKSNLFPTNAQQQQAGVLQVPVKISTKGLSQGENHA